MRSKISLSELSFKQTYDAIKRKAYSDLDNGSVCEGSDIIWNSSLCNYDKDIIKKYLLIYYSIIGAGRHIDKDNIITDILLKLAEICPTDAELNGLCNLAKLYNYDYIKVLNILDK